MPTLSNKRARTQQEVDDEETAQVVAETAAAEKEEAAAKLEAAAELAADKKRKADGPRQTQKHLEICQN